MAVQTRPLRVLEADHSALRLFAALTGRSPSGLFHEAFAEYLGNHRQEFLADFARAQQMIAGRDVEALSAELRTPDELTRTDFEAEIASLR
jgi:hypothetical protein